MNNLLKRLLELSKRTGDRIVFADLEGDNAYVVLALYEYERLVLGGSSKDIPRQRVESPISEREKIVNLSAPRSAASPLDEMSREVVRTLEAERAETEIEPEERYFLEPIE